MAIPEFPAAPFDPDWVEGGGGGGAVDSVNGQTGTVVIDADDVNAVPVSTTANRIYGTDNAGAPALLQVSDAATGSTVALRDVTGHVVTAAPTDGAHATTKTYVDSAVAGASGVPPVATANRIYGTDGTGVQTTYPLAAAATADTLALRGALGVLQVGTPTAAAHATTKTYVDTAVATAVPRVVTASRIYGTDGAGAQTSYPFAAAATADTLALRGALGVLQVGTPTTGAHATTKTYVDNLAATKVQKLGIPDRIYGTNPSGVDNSYVVAEAASAGSVPIRTASGNVVTAAPTADSHAATKKYVDDNSGGGGGGGIAPLMIDLNGNEATLGADGVNATFMSLNMAGGTITDAQYIFNNGPSTMWAIANGPTGDRNYMEPQIGAMYFDTSTGQPTWFNGDDWVLADGTAAPVEP